MHPTTTDTTYYVLHGEDGPLLDDDGIYIEAEGGYVHATTDPTGYLVQLGTDRGEIVEVTADEDLEVRDPVGGDILATWVPTELGDRDAAAIRTHEAVANLKVDRTPCPDERVDGVELHITADEAAELIELMVGCDPADDPEPGEWSPSLDHDEPIAGHTWAITSGAAWTVIGEDRELVQVYSDGTTDQVVIHP